MNQKNLIIARLFAVVYILLAFFFFHETKKLAVNEAEECIAGFLLNHQAIQHYVEEIQKPEIYHLKKEGKLYEEYFSPKILSGTYINRHIMDVLNSKRSQMGLNEVHFKLASINPRNEINRVNTREMRVLQKFNSGEIQEYKEIIKEDGRDFLFYAIPFTVNKESCMRCHGDPAAAPRELLARYGGKTGFHEKIGDIRALTSVLAPLDELLTEAHDTALTLSAIAFILLSSILGMLLFFIRRLDIQQEELAQNSLYMENILRSSTTMAIAATDRDLHIKYFNPKAERIFGCKAEEILGKTMSEIHKLKKVTLDDFDNAIKQVQEQGVYHYLIEHQTPTEIIYIDCQLTGIWDHNNNLDGFVLMSRDITEDRRKTQEKEQIQDKLRRAQKMEAIGLMAGSVAHDLNNILSGIINYPELLLMKLPEESELRKPLKAIQQSGQRAAAVVNDLLTVARGVANAKITTNLNTLLSEHLDSLEYKKLKSLHAKVKWSTELDPHLENISCSAIHIKKCIMNLTTNAAEAIDNAGSIVISTRNQFVDEAMAIKYDLKTADYVVLNITDTGSGIPEQYIDHIFEPFYTKKIMGKSGTGLGLAVVWNTVKDHNGEIIVHSSSKGTTFELYFPVCREESALPAESKSEEYLRGSGEKILVVDDQQQQRDIADKLLTSLGYQIHSVNSGEKAIEFLKDNKVDLVLLDMLMEPGINGRKTYEEIIKIHPGQRAVIASGFSDNEEVQRARELGAKQFIKKPYSREQLGLAIAAGLDK